MQAEPFGATRVFTAAVSLWWSAWLPLTGVGFLASLAIEAVLWPLGTGNGFRYVLDFGLGALMTGVIVLLAADALAGGPYRLGAHVQHVLSLAGAIFALNLFTVIVMALGFMLLIIPGIYALALFLPLMPVLLLEKHGWTSIQRTMDLTRPHVVGVIGLVFWLMGAVVLASLPLVGIVSAFPDDGSFDILNLGVGLFFGANLGAVVSCVTLVTYQRLLELSGGGGSNVERVFE